ncbi:MAG: fumarylacetoacetate hydrolase family protein [Pseudomonadota bacterium]
MYVFQPPKQTSLAIQNSEKRFPVRRIFCVGRNYVAHALEMGNDPKKDPPVFFTKPADAALDTPCTIPYPPLTEDYHHEVELVIAIGKGGANIAEEHAMDHVWGAGVGLDMTRRDIQAEAQQSGRPWDMSKGFDNSAPISALRPIQEVESLETGRIWLSVNGETRQDADLSELIWPVRAHLAILSQAVTLAPGDLIMTGTPAGVGAVLPGDVMTGGVDGVGRLEVTIGPKAS